MGGLEGPPHTEADRSTPGERRNSFTLVPSAASVYTHAMRDVRRSLGREAEAAAAALLERAGLRVLERNVRFALGEIDLVCRERDTIVFVEVKCRQANWGDGPAAAVSWHKQRRLARLAELYLKWRGLRDTRCRFDVVAVTVGDHARPTLRHIRGAFDAPSG